MLAAASLVLAVVGTAQADSGSDVVSVPVSFEVVTDNQSGLPCAVGGAIPSLLPIEHHETVRGHITGSRHELDNHRLNGTVYTHGDGYDESFWRYPRNNSYNYADQMARRGHISITFNRLGYGDSTAPNGNDICFGTEASVVHQIIGQLRNGDYRGARTPHFDRLGLVGQSAGGFIAEQEAAGFHDIDALGVLDAGELNAMPLLAIRSGQQQVRCLTDSRHGYAGLEADGRQFADDHIYNADPEVADYLVSHRTIDACAGTRNAAQTLAGDGVRNSLIKVPVLVLSGANDKFFPHPQLQAKAYTQSRKVTVEEVPATGHAVAFSREYRRFQDSMNTWLNSNHL
ncbi:alpha/beta hydrolase [Pseudonocardia spinosispora]|uniref:alpha/beta hydrolase n=1 Tax=Pseudonocardia spinosispora TaxID=103441 RepID=UPI0004224EC4|nr:alpha/beta hydrolase [Pseudonocardia spinosispora]